MHTSVLLGTLLVFGLRALNTTLTTTRLLLVMRGLRWQAVVVGFMEALVFVVAIAQVLSDVNDVWRVTGYSAGFALGTLIGMVLEDKLALGVVVVRVVVPTPTAGQVAAALRGAGYGVTETLGFGRDNLVEVINTVVRRKEAPHVVAITESVDNQAFITVEETRSVRRGRLRAAP